MSKAAPAFAIHLYQKTYGDCPLPEMPVPQGRDEAIAVAKQWLETYQEPARELKPGYAEVRDGAGELVAKFAFMPGYSLRVV